MEEVQYIASVPHLRYKPLTYLINVHVHSSVSLLLHSAATMHKWQVLESSVFELLPVYHIPPKDEDEKRVMGTKQRLCDPCTLQLHLGG
jgi:hypothetical protein